MKKIKYELYKYQNYIESVLLYSAFLFFVFFIIEIFE